MNKCANQSTTWAKQLPCVVSSGGHIKTKKEMKKFKFCAECYIHIIYTDMLAHDSCIRYIWMASQYTIYYWPSLASLWWISSAFMEGLALHTSIHVRRLYSNPLPCSHTSFKHVHWLLYVLTPYDTLFPNSSVSGIYGLANGVLDSPWKKLVYGKALFSDIVTPALTTDSISQEQLTGQLLHLLKNQKE